MLRAYSRLMDGTSEALDTVEGIASAWSQPDTTIWVDLASPDEATLKSVGQVFGLSADSLEDCLYGEQRPRIDEFDDHIFMVLYGMVGVDDETDFDPRKLATFCGSRFLITVHREQLKTMREMRARADRHINGLLNRGVDFVLFSIIDAMVDKYAIVAETYERRIDDLEDDALDRAADDSLLTQSSALRHKLMELRHIAASQRELMIPIAKGEYDYISESLEMRLSHVRDHLSQVVDRIDSYREMLINIREIYQSSQSHEMNVAMKTLTIFATILLPMTLIAGIYGMNLPLWPPPDEPWSFWFVTASMAVLAGGLFLLFRKLKWL